MLNGESGKMLKFLVSSFAGLKTKLLLGSLVLLGLLTLAGLSYKAGRSDGYELAQAKYLESVDQNKDRVIEELRVLQERQLAGILENRRANLNLSSEFNSKIDKISQKVKVIPYEYPVVVDSDCRADYDGTIGVFKHLAKNPTDSN